MAKKEFARTDQWLQDWHRRCDGVTEAVQLGEYQMAIQKTNKCLRDLVQEIGREKCENHPDGCPPVQIDDVTDIPIILQNIKVRCAFEMAHVVQWN